MSNNRHSRTLTPPKTIRAAKWRLTSGNFGIIIGAKWAAIAAMFLNEDSNHRFTL